MRSQRVQFSDVTKLSLRGPIEPIRDGWLAPNCHMSNTWLRIPTVRIFEKRIRNQIVTLLNRFCTPPCRIFLLGRGLTKNPRNSLIALWYPNSKHGSCPRSCPSLSESVAIGHIAHRRVTTARRRR